MPSKKPTEAPTTSDPTPKPSKKIDPIIEPSAEPSAGPRANLNANSSAERSEVTDELSEPTAKPSVLRTREPSAESSIKLSADSAEGIRVIFNLSDAAGVTLTPTLTDDAVVHIYLDSTVEDLAQSNLPELRKLLLSVMNADAALFDIEFEILAGSAVILVRIRARTPGPVANQKAQALVAYFDASPRRLQGYPVQAATSLSGFWTEWINNHHPHDADGDKESFEQANAMHTLCPGGRNATKIFCKTADGQWWNETGQVFKEPCTVTRGLVCQNNDNLKGCFDYKYLSFKSACTCA